jgi:hypothetical protein
MKIEDKNTKYLYNVGITIKINPRLIPEDSATYELVNNYLQRKIKEYVNFMDNDIMNELQKYEWSSIPKESECKVIESSNSIVENINYKDDEETRDMLLKLLEDSLSIDPAKLN